SSRARLSRNGFLGSAPQKNMPDLQGKSPKRNHRPTSSQTARRRFARAFRHRNQNHGKTFGPHGGQHESSSLNLTDGLSPHALSKLCSPLGKGCRNYSAGNGPISHFGPKR